MHQTNSQQRVLGAVSDGGYSAGRGAGLEDLRRSVEIAARCSVSVLISGGNRRTRQTLARLIHEESARRAEPFIVLDLQSASNHCSELLSQGSLFVEEAQDLSSSMQARLLRILEQQSLSPVAIRVIAGATQDLVDKACSGTFSPDLFYRLNAIHLVI